MAATEAEEVTPEGMKALAEAATPGPWHRHTYGHRDIRQQVRIIGKALRASSWPSTDMSWVHPEAADGPSICLTGNGPMQVENADYIAAHDPTLLALLWDVVREAESGTDATLTVALNAVYAHIGYEP